MARNRTPEERREAKRRKRERKREVRRRFTTHLATTPSGQKVAVTDTGMILGLQDKTVADAVAAVAPGWPKDSHTKVVMDFCETWGSEGLAALFSPRQSFKVA